MRILLISGSLRRDSHNTKLLRAAAELLPPGTEHELLDAGVLKAVPPYSEDDDAGERPAAVVALRRAIERADGVLFSTPEYNGSIPGQLKNALDWVSRPVATTALRGKPVAVVGASTSLFGAVWAQAETRKVLGALGGRVVEAELPVARAGDVYRDGRLELSPEQSHQLEEMLATLVAEAEQLRELVPA